MKDFIELTGPEGPMAIRTAAVQAVVSKDEGARVYLLELQWFRVRESVDEVMRRMGYQPTGDRE